MHVGCRKRRGSSGSIEKSYKKICSIGIWVIVSFIGSFFLGLRLKRSISWSTINAERTNQRFIAVTIKYKANIRDYKHLSFML